MSDTKKTDEMPEPTEQEAQVEALHEELDAKADTNAEAANSSANAKGAGAIDSDKELDELAELKEQLAKQAEEAAAMKDAYVRAKAEEENVRRRAEKEVANSRKFAVEGFAKELLSVRDSLAIAAALELDGEEQDKVKGMKDGVDITLKQLDSAFAKFAIVAVEAKPGDALDPNVHQAMSIVESEEVKSGCIVNVIQSGFTMHERLLRPAMVVVAK